MTLRSSRLRTFGQLTLLVGTALALTGCQSWSARRSNEKSASVKPIQREELVAGFETHRNEVQLAAAQSAWRSGNLADCRLYLDSLLRRVPDHRAGSLLYAQLQAAEADHDQAVDRLEALAEKRPDDAEVQHALGLILLDAGRDEEAVPCFRRATELDGASAVYQASYRQALSTALEEEDVETDASDGDDGSESLPELISDAPSSDRNDWIDRADRLLHAERLESARRLLLDSLEPPDRTASDFLQASTLALRHEQLELARELARLGLDRYGDHAGLWRALATSQYRLGEDRECQVSLQQSLQLDTSHPLTYFLLGSLLEKQGQREAAQRHFERARSLDPRYSQLPRRGK
jgi:Flp pilus assembly protein TadD